MPVVQVIVRQICFMFAKVSRGVQCAWLLIHPAYRMRLKIKSDFEDKVRHCQARRLWFRGMVFTKVN